ncbi:hypothetical protein CG723_43845 [Streptomyces sp. CB01635]|nr:hypothetical protein CG723_43845 [Streptomyces sp. CB01635]
MPATHQVPRVAGKGISTAQPDARVERGNRTRQAVLSPTVEIVSVEGLQAPPRAELEVPSLVQQLSGHRDLAGLRTRGTDDLQHVRPLRDHLVQVHAITGQIIPGCGGDLPAVPQTGHPAPPR